MCFGGANKMRCLDSNTQNESRRSVSFFYFYYKQIDSTLPRLNIRRKTKNIFKFVSRTRVYLLLSVSTNALSFSVCVDYNDDDDDAKLSFHNRKYYLERITNKTTHTQNRLERLRSMNKSKNGNYCVKFV